VPVDEDGIFKGEGELLCRTTGGIVVGVLLMMLGVVKVIGRVWGCGVGALR
jgi:hypothetical protein